MAASPAERGTVPLRWGLIGALSIVYLSLASVQAVLIRVVSYEAFEADGPSMEPTIVDSDRFVVDKSVYGLTIPFASAQLVHWADPVPGDVVVLRSPYDDVDIIKRVIGVPGDRIEIRSDVVYRNGEPIQVAEATACASDATQRCVEEAIGARRWVTMQDESTIEEDMPEVTVGQGTVFVLGDHRDRSNDSRNPRVGAVPVARVRGRVVLVYWSDRRGRAGTWIE
jgi:signal peptidase I